MANEKISVSAEALRELIVAAIGPPHHMRELQVMRGSPIVDSCIDKLQREFNEWASAKPKTETDYQALYEAKCDELATLKAELTEAQRKAGAILGLIVATIDTDERGYIELSGISPGNFWRAVQACGAKVDLDACVAGARAYKATKGRKQ